MMKEYCFGNKMLSYTKQQIRDAFLGLLSMAAVIFTVQFILLLFYNYALINNLNYPIFANKWFLMVEKLIRIGIVSIIGLVLYKKIKVSKEYSKSLLITLLLYILAAFVEFIFSHFGT